MGSKKAQIDYAAVSSIPCNKKIKENYIYYNS